MQAVRLRTLHRIQNHGAIDVPQVVMKTQTDCHSNSQGLDNLRADSALKVPLAELAESKERVRSALNRATRKAGAKCDRQRRAFLYVWTVNGLEKLRKANKKGRR